MNALEVSYCSKAIRKRERRTCRQACGLSIAGEGCEWRPKVSRRRRRRDGLKGARASVPITRRAESRSTYVERVCSRGQHRSECLRKRESFGLMLVEGVDLMV